MTRREILLATAAVGAAPSSFAQEPQEPPVEWVCPMDPDVRANAAGKCPRCGMALVPGIPTPVPYPVRLQVTPRNWRAGQRVRMRFEVLHPQTDQRVNKLLLVHERYFHLFLVSGDLAYFAHEHPERQPDGSFVHETTLPKPGMYRLLCDFYPDGGTPQMAVKTILSAGTKLDDLAPPKLELSLRPQLGRNLTVALRTEPALPMAGLKTMLFFDLSPSSGLQPYLGAWGHLLAASDDLIDLIHTHPFLADGGATEQFNIVFPRAGMYRLWPQFQRRGVVNTVSFTVAVKEIG